MDMKIKEGMKEGSKRYIVDLRKLGLGRKYFTTFLAAKNFLKNQERQLDGVRVPKFVDERENKIDFNFDKVITDYIEELNYNGKNVHNKERTMHEIKNIKIANTRLADMKVRNFLVGDIQTVIKAIRVGRSAKTVSETLAHFRQLLTYAVLDGVVSTNVFTQLPKGSTIYINNKEEKKLRSPISEDVIHALADTMKGQPKVMFLFAAYTGLRSGELRSLEWNDLDLKEGWVDVRKTIVTKRTFIFGDGIRYIRSTTSVKPRPKSYRGNRKVPLLDETIALLRKYKIAQKTESKLVFPSNGSRGGEVISGSRFPELMKAAAKQANVERIRWHDLRHYYASQILKIYGNDWRTIMTYMGHASIQTTINIYGHWLENKEERILNRKLLNEKLGKVASQ
tara:strand:+ start:858 stop:2042 length:1185 start_codon:yes stop_codon:yes gene_type:complete